MTFICKIDNLEFLDGREVIEHHVNTKHTNYSRSQTEESIKFPEKYPDLQISIQDIDIKWDYMKTSFTIVSEEKIVISNL